MSGIAITFPSSPIEGQSYLAQNGFTYIYDSQKNRWKRGGEFVRAPKILTLAGISVTTTGSGISTGPNGALIYAVSGGSSISPASVVGLDSFKAYRTTDSYPNYSEIQVSISSAFSTIAYAATFADTTHTIPTGSLSGGTEYYIRGRQFVGSNASAASTGAISGYSQNIVKFTTQSVFIDVPTIVSIAGSTRFPVYQIGYASTTLPATVTYTGNGLSNLDKVEWKVTGPRIPSSTGNTALAEVGIGTHSSTTLANALVLAMPFSGASGVGITSDVNNAIRTASGASAGTTKTITVVGSATTANVGIATTTAHFYPSAAYFNGSNQYLNAGSSSDYLFGTGDFTIESWFYLTRNSSRQDLCGNYSGASTGWGVALGDASSNGMYFYYGNTTYAATSAGLWATNRWNHIALSRKSGVLSIYLNGSIVSSASASVDVSTTSYSTFIGAVTDTSGNPQLYCMGYLQDFKIYKGLAKYTENFTPPLPTYGTISYTTGDPFTTVGVATTAFFESTGDVGIAETSSTAANALVLAMPMNRTFGFQDINVAIRGLTSGASAGTAKTVGLGTTSTANAPSHPRISSTESKWYDGAAYFDGGDYATIQSSGDFYFPGDNTIECWIYPTISQGDSFIFGTGGSGSSDQFGFATGSGNARLYWGYSALGGQYLVTTGTIIPNAWNHLAICRSGNTLRGFINGILSGSGTVSVAIGQTATAYLGMRSANDNFTTGYIQDLKVYKGFAKYTANFTPPQPICGFSTDISTQTGFTTTTATGALLSSVVGLGSTSSLSFSADQNLIGVTSITSSSGITTLPDPYAQNLVLALPLANITGAGNSFTNDRNTQIRSVSITGAGVTAGTTKTITNSGVTTSTISKWYGNSAYFDGGDRATLTYDNFFTNNATVEFWVNFANNNQYQGLFGGGVDLYGINLQWQESVDGKLNLFVGTGSGWGSGYTSSTVLTSGRWYHIAYVKIGDRHFVYIDGTLDSSISGVSASHTWSGSTFYIGNPMLTSRYLNGYLQDFRIYTTAKYTTNFTPPPPMFGDYTRSTPNKIIFTPGSDYVLEARNTSGVTTSSYSATRQWGTKPKGGIYDPYASSLVLALPMNNTTTFYDTTGQIKLETPTSSYSSGQTVTSPSGSTHTNKSVTNTNTVTFVTTQSKYYGYSGAFTRTGNKSIDIPDQTDIELGNSDFTIELWLYLSNSTSQYEAIFSKPGNSDANGYMIYKETDGGIQFNAATGGGSNWNISVRIGSASQMVSRWTHVAITRSGSTINAWRDGVLVGTDIDSGTIVDNGNSLLIGKYTQFPGGVTYSFDGYISDFRMYKGIAKYTSNFTPPNQIYVA